MVNIPGASTPTSNLSINTFHLHGEYLYFGYGINYLVFHYWHSGNEWAQVYTEYGNESYILPRWMWCSV